MLLLGTLSRETFRLNQGTGAEIQTLLVYLTLNIPIAAADKPVDAIEKSPILAADVALVGGVPSKEARGSVFLKRCSVAGSLMNKMNK
eukprot:IDg3528t1